MTEDLWELIDKGNYIVNYIFFKIKMFGFLV